MSDNKEALSMRCEEVLAVLSDYLDGDLDENSVTRVNDHLRGCCRCDRFGKVFSTTVAEVRASMESGETLPQDMRESLRHRLRSVLTTS